MNEPMMDFDALERLADPAEVEMLAAELEPLEQEADLMVFIAPGCPVCPHQVKAAVTLAMATERVGLEIVDVSQEPELAAHYEIRSVPTTVVDDELIMVGVVPAPELGRRLLERQGPGGQNLVFRSLVRAGHHADAGERLSDGRGAEAFLELWASSTMEERVGLLLVAEESLVYHPEGLNPLVPRLIAELENAASTGKDDAWRGDTIDLLGRIGHADARGILERLVDDPNDDVGVAAEDALDRLAG